MGRGPASWPSHRSPSGRSTTAGPGRTSRFEERPWPGADPAATGPTSSGHSVASLAVTGMPRPRALADAPVQASLWERVKAAGGAVGRGLGTAASYVNPFAWYRWATGDDGQNNQQQNHVPAQNNVPQNHQNAPVVPVVDHDGNGHDSEDDNLSEASFHTAREDFDSGDEQDFDSGDEKDIDFDDEKEPVRPDPTRGIVPPSYQELQRLHSQWDQGYARTQRSSRKPTGHPASSSSSSQEIALDDPRLLAAAQRAHDRLTHGQKRGNKVVSHKKGKGKVISEEQQARSVRQMAQRMLQQGWKPKEEDSDDDEEES